MKLKTEIESRKIMFLFPFGAWVQYRLKKVAAICAVCWLILYALISGEFMARFFDAKEAVYVSLFLSLAPIVHLLGLYLKYKISEKPSEIVSCESHFTLYLYTYFETDTYRFDNISYRRGLGGFLLNYAHITFHLLEPDEGKMTVNSCINMKQLRQVLEFIEKEKRLR